MISKIIIKNYKGIKDANIVLNKDRNILVGNNGVGKSTVIEALTLALGFGLRDLDITPYLFHTSTWKEDVNSKKTSVNRDRSIFRRRRKDQFFSWKEQFAQGRYGRNTPNHSIRFCLFRII